MRMTSGPSSMRDRLAALTRPDHEALHDHPWIARLAHADLRVEHYRAILRAYWGFFRHVETARMHHGSWAQLSLADPITDLWADCTGLGVTEAPCVDDYWLAEPMEVLAALYVVHGSGFGGRVLGRGVAAALPGAPRAYLCRGTSPDLWRRLIAELDRHSSDAPAADALLQGTRRCFRAFGRHVTISCASADASGLPAQRLPPADRPLHKSHPG